MSEVKASNAVKNLPHFGECLQWWELLCSAFKFSFNYKKEEREREIIVKNKFQLTVGMGHTKRVEYLYVSGNNRYLYVGICADRCVCDRWVFFTACLLQVTGIC